MHNRIYKFKTSTFRISVRKLRLTASHRFAETFSYVTGGSHMPLHLSKMNKDYSPNRCEWCCRKPPYWILSSAAGTRPETKISWFQTSHRLSAKFKMATKKKHHIDNGSNLYIHHLFYLIGNENSQEVWILLAVKTNGNDSSNNLSFKLLLYFISRFLIKLFLRT